MRIIGRLSLLGASLLTAASLAACSSSSAYPGSSTPQAALETFFSSAQQLDYATTYACYYEPYHNRVTEQEFVSHRKQASALSSYRIRSISAKDGSAEASVTLTFAPTSRSNNKPRSVEVREDLVNQAGAWKIKVW
jgi:hypothetical protein